MKNPITIHSSLTLLHLGHTLGVSFFSSPLRAHQLTKPGVDGRAWPDGLTHTTAHVEEDGEYVGWGWWNPSTCGIEPSTWRAERLFKAVRNDMPLDTLLAGIRSFLRSRRPTAALSTRLGHHTYSLSLLLEDFPHDIRVDVIKDEQYAGSCRWSISGRRLLPESWHGPAGVRGLLDHETLEGLSRQLSSTLLPEPSRG